MNPIAASPKRGVVVWNESADWTGNYATKNVTGLSFQMRNASINDPLYLRVAIGDTRNPMSGTWFVSDSLRLLSYNDGWSSITLILTQTLWLKHQVL